MFSVVAHYSYLVNIKLECNWFINEMNIFQNYCIHVCTILLQWNAD